jgi:hypothetical protein
VEVSLAVDQEVARDLELLGVLVSYGRNAIRSELIDPGVWIRQQDGGVGGDEELGPPVDHVIGNQLKER